MHILLIHQAFVTVKEAGGTRHAELAHWLIQKGHQVTVITSPVSYLTGENQPDIQKKPIDRIDGIDVYYCYTSGGLHKGFFPRVMSFFSFMFSSIKTAKKVQNIDIVWGTSPNLFQAFAAWVIAKQQKKKFLLEIRDLWPDFAVGMGVLKNRFLIQASLWLEKFLYAHADRIIVNSPGFIPHIQKISGKTALLVPNGADPDLFVSTDGGFSFRREHQLEEKFVVMYTGAHGPANDLFTVLKAAELLRGDDRIRIVLVGSGKEKDLLIKRKEEKGLNNVLFVPPVPKEKIADVIAAADAGLAVLKAIPLFTTTYPNKVFDFMAAGKPVLCQIDGVIRDLVEQYDVGLFVTPGDPQALKEAILLLADSPEDCKRMGQNGIRTIREHFSRKKIAEDFERILSDLLI